ncbi:transcriptional regulator [Leptospira santarosai]|uniref:transcriptional regulator n=1 Tax=Leptospira santarosai TaxID=28183 RepID=UPI0009C0D8CB|nr:transcriptional regulator [Leptospira santarosai]
MKERLEELLSALSMNRSGFATEFGVSRSVLSEITSGRIKNLPDHVLYRLITERNLNANWWFTGEGEIFSPVTPLSGKTPKEKIRAIEEMRRLRQIIPLDIAEAAKNNPELLELIKLVSKIPADKYQQIKRILKSFLL